MKYRLVLSERFGKDFDAALNFLKEQSQQAAMNFIEEIEKKIKILASFPKIGKKPDDARLEGLRFLIITQYNYIIIYEINPEEKMVFLHNLLHGSRDIPALFQRLNREI